MRKYNMFGKYMRKLYGKYIQYLHNIFMKEYTGHAHKSNVKDTICDLFLAKYENICKE